MIPFHYDHTKTPFALQMEFNGPDTTAVILVQHPGPDISSIVIEFNKDGWYVPEVVEWGCLNGKLNDLSNKANVIEVLDTIHKIIGFVKG